MIEMKFNEFSCRRGSSSGRVRMASKAGTSQFSSARLPRYPATSLTGRMIKSN